MDLSAVDHPVAPQPLVGVELLAAVEINQHFVVAVLTRLQQVLAEQVHGVGDALGLLLVSTREGEQRTRFDRGAADGVGLLQHHCGPAGLRDGEEGGASSQARTQDEHANTFGDVSPQGQAGSGGRHGCSSSLSATPVATAAR